MNREGLRKIADSTELTKGEKTYILDIEFHMGGSFIKSLFDTIALADDLNLYKLSVGFPEEVQGYIAWSRGDLYERATKIAGGPADKMTL